MTQSCVRQRQTPSLNVFGFPPQTVAFPSVTICNLNIVKKSKLKRFSDVQEFMRSFSSFANQRPVNNSNSGHGMGNASGSSSSSSSSFGPPSRMKNALKKELTGDSSEAEEKVTLGNVTFDDQTYAEETMISQLGNHRDDDLQDAGHAFEELVYRCTWGGFSCNEG